MASKNDITKAANIAVDKLLGVPEGTSKYILTEAMNIIADNITGGGGGVPNPPVGSLSDGEMIRYLESIEEMVGTGDINTDTEVDFGSKDIKCKTVITESESVDIGPGLTLSDKGGDLLNASNVTGDKYIPVDSRFDEAAGSDIPEWAMREPLIIMGIVQADDSQQMLDINSYVADPTENQDVSRVYLKFINPVTDFRARVISDVTGEIVKYIPSRNDFDSETGLSLGTGEQYFDLPSSLREVIGYPLTVEMFANEPIDVLGDGVDPWRALDKNIIVDETMALSKDVLQSSTLRSGIIENYSIAAITGDTEIEITAETGNEFEVYFNLNDSPNNLDGFFIDVPNQVLTVPNTTEALKYYVSVDNTGAISTEIFKSDAGDLTRVHLFSYGAQNGAVIVSSITNEPFVSWVDKSFMETLECQGRVVTDLRIGSQNNATLGLTNSNYKIIENGINYDSNKIGVHCLSVAADPMMNWTYALNNSDFVPSVGTEVLFDPTQWDDNGVLTPVTQPNDATIQAVYSVSKSEFVILYGQQVFANYEDAILNVYSLDFEIPDVGADWKEVARIVSIKDATDTADINEVSIFQTTGGGGGSITQAGDMIGPGSSTVGRAAIFADDTGKKIEEGTIDQGTYAFEGINAGTGTAPNNYQIIGDSRGLPAGAGLSNYGFNLKADKTDGSQNIFYGYSPTYGGTVQIQGVHMFFRNFASGTADVSPRIMMEAPPTTSATTNTAVWDASNLADYYNGYALSRNTSSVSMKANIEPITDIEPSSLDLIDRIIPIKYDAMNKDGLTEAKIADPDKLPENRGSQWDIFGFSAENVADVIPQSAILDSEGNPTNIGERGLLAIAYQGIKELRAELEILKSEIEILKGR